MSVRIEPLRVADADAVARLQNHLWRVTYRGLVPEEVLAARDDARNIGLWRGRAAAHERTGCSTEGARTWVAHDEAGLPIGWASSGPPRDDEAPPTPLELWSLYVAEEHHGSGVARRLLDAALTPGSAHAWVIRGNARAIAFYRKAGFVPDGTVAHDVRLGADEVRLVRGAPLH